MTEQALPPVTDKPCAECPWRKDSTPGHLGPHTATEWVDAIHGEGAIACHMTIKDTVDGEGDWAHPKMRQCAGAAQMRTNAFKLPRNPEVVVAENRDDSLIFGDCESFAVHHEGRPPDMTLALWSLLLDYPLPVRGLNALLREGVDTVHALDDLINGAGKGWLESMHLTDIRGIGMRTRDQIVEAVNRWKEKYK